MTTHAGGVVRLPVQPLTAMAVVRAVRQPDASAKELARLIELDPALSATVLRMANAPHLGLSRRVSSARQAVVLLGVKTVSALAVSGAAALVFDATDAAMPPGYWAHAVTTAVAAAALARRIGHSPDEAFTAGLVHDLGALVLHSRGQLPVAGPKVAAANVLAAEATLAGKNHADLGADLMADWLFPDALVRATRLHHARPDAVTEPLARLVLAANALANTTTDGRGRAGAAAPRDALELVGLGAEKPATLTSEVQRESAAIAAFVTQEAA